MSVATQRILAVVVTHNRYILLSRCLDYLHNQVRPPNGLVVINNGSTDNTEAMLRELYRTLARNRRAIRLIDVCARDYPELAELWFRGGREATVAMLERYVGERSRRGAFRSFADIAIVARFVLETVVLWAVHRHWDPHPQPIDDAAAENVVIDLLLGALLRS